MTLQQLRQRSAELLSRQPRLIVQVEADESSRYSTLAEVIEAVQGIPGVAPKRVDVVMRRVGKQMSKADLGARWMGENVRALAEKMTADAEVDAWKDGEPLLPFVTNDFPELKEVRAAMSTADFATVLDAAKVKIDFTDAGDFQLAAWRIRDESFLAVFKSNRLINVVRSGGLTVEAWRRKLLRSNSPKPVDEARQRFLNIEKFARLPSDQQANQLPYFYRDVAPLSMGPFVEMVLSSFPRNILDRETGFYDGNTSLWAKQLAGAAKNMSPDDVADKLGGPLWQNVAARARALQVLKLNSELVAELIQDDLDSGKRMRLKRATTAIVALKLSAFNGGLVKMLLEDGEYSQIAYNALIWSGDSSIGNALLAEIKKQPQLILRCSGLLQKPLFRKPAGSLLLTLLESSDPEIRYHATNAVYECVDPKLAGPIVKFANDKETRMRVSACYLASNLPLDAYRPIRKELISLLEDSDEEVRFAALQCFGKRKDIACGTTILKLLKQDDVEAGYQVTVMQALQTLADTHFGYDMHSWGLKSKENKEAVERFEAWLQDKLASKTTQSSVLTDGQSSDDDTTVDRVTPAKVAIGKPTITSRNRKTVDLTSMQALSAAWGDKETERLQFAPLQAIELGFDDGEPIVVLQPETSVRYLDLATGKTRPKRDEFPSDGEVGQKMAGRFQLKIEPDRAAGFQTFRIGGVDTFLGSTKVDVGDNGNWSRHLKQTPRQAMQEIHNVRWAMIRHQPNDPDAWKKAISNNDFTFNPATDLPLTVTFISDNASGWLRIEDYDAKTAQLNMKILRLQAKQKPIEVARNEWYALFEIPRDETSSYFETEIFKPDAQLGIGIFVDIGKLASDRGFKYLNVLSKPDDDRTLVKFQNEKPEDSEKSFDVASLVSLYEARLAEEKADEQE